MIEWKLSQVISDNGLTPLQVEREAIRLGFGVGRSTLYRIVRDDGPSRIDRLTLDALIASMRSLTGKPIDVSDILSYAE